MSPEVEKRLESTDLDGRAEEISSALGKEYAHSILLAADRPVGAGELSERYDIPIATCYRRVKELEECGLLEEVEVDPDDGRRETKYRRTVDEIAISYDTEQVTVTLDRSANASSTLDTIWQRFGP